MNYWIYFSLFAAAVAIYAMVDILMIKASNTKKMVWFALIVIIPVIGPLIYLLKKRSIAESSLKRQ